MQLTTLKRTSIGKKIFIDDNAIIVFIPSISHKIWDAVYETPFLMSNCRGIIVPNKVFKINKKPFNGRLHYLDAKKQLVELKNVTKKIPIFGSIGSIKTKVEDDQKKKIKQFYFYDTSTTQQAVHYFLEKLPEKKIFQIYISELRNIYASIKKEYPKRRVMLVADIQNQNDLFYLFLTHFRQLKGVLHDVLEGPPFFDGFFYVSVNQRLLPMLEYDLKENLVPIQSMISRLDKFIENAELAEEINGAPAISDKESSEGEVTPNKSLATKIVDALQNPEALLANRKNFVPEGQVMKEKAPPKTKALDVKAKANDDDETIKIELNDKTLSKVMKYYKVTNPDVIANVKAAIDSYIKETGVVPTKGNAEMLVLRAVSKSVHGTDKVDELYLAKPNLLFDKLKEINVFSVPLEIPKVDKKFPFEFNEIISLKSVTGQHRQKYEFTELIHENVEKVFSILENQTHPIKVLGISHEFVDNNSDRFIQYSIKLQNMDGNKQKYDIKLNIPTVINDKYFKLGGNRSYVSI